MSPFPARPALAENRSAPPRTYPKKVVDLVGDTLVIDMLHPIKIDEKPAPMTPALAREWRSTGLGAILDGVGTFGADARDQTLAFHLLWTHYIAVNGDVFAGVDTMDDILRARRDGKVAVIMGMQNSDHFAKVEDVAFFHGLGQRVSQLTYNAQNRLGSGSTERVDGGVTDFGAAIIAEMNKVGMLIDVSHCGPRTTLDAIAISPRPIAITHTNCRALNDHPRLKTDEAIRACAAGGGVVGISGIRNFVSATEPTTLATMVDHIDHVVKLVGIEHVGIGSDADNSGYDDMPPQMQKAMKAALSTSYAWRDRIDTDGYDHPRRIYDLAEELMRRNYSAANVKAVLSGNFQRLLTETWKKPDIRSSAVPAVKG